MKLLRKSFTLLSILILALVVLAACSAPDYPGESQQAEQPAEQAPERSVEATAVPTDTPSPAPTATVVIMVTDSAPAKDLVSTVDTNVTAQAGVTTMPSSGTPPSQGGYNPLWWQEFPSVGSAYCDTTLPTQTVEVFTEALDGTKFQLEICMGSTNPSVIPAECEIGRPGLTGGWECDQIFDYILNPN